MGNSTKKLSIDFGHFGVFEFFDQQKPPEHGDPFILGLVFEHIEAYLFETVEAMDFACGP